jgi:hypothetical protein
MAYEDKMLIKEELRKRIDITSIKERARLTKIFEIL